MSAIVVYESFWGNTTKVARAIAEGLGSDARALTTDQATDEALAEADLVVVGAPIIGFSLVQEAGRAQLARERKAPTPADLSHPSMRSWLEALPKGEGRFAVFETGLGWSPSGAHKAMTAALTGAGYTEAAPRERFLVAGRYGPLKDGEIERARQWGVTLAG
ncbi:MAG: flavodoxin [Actinobacteria bacterium]|nr:flavodoxin [Actinomycetota bacterium]